MRATVVTLFPDLIHSFLGTSVLGRGVAAGHLDVAVVDLRAYGEGRHRTVDDRPFGGGPGMVLMAEPLLRAVEEARARHGPAVRTILLTPQGDRLRQPTARALAAAPDGFILVCGRYEGVDERFRALLEPEELSIGDYVLTGGEVPAMVVLEAAGRLVPGVLGDERSPEEESFGEGGLLDHPQYTRPLEVRGLGVPDVLRSGDHAAIARWRHEQALARTRARRPDLLAGEDAEGG